MSNNKLPIIVGGTNYYIESLLWNVLIGDDDENARQMLAYDYDNYLLRQFYGNENKEHFTDDDISKDNILSAPIVMDRFKDVNSDQLHEVLKQIDPKAALRLHPNEKRKIIRCLQVFQKYGKTYTEIIEEQCSQDGGSHLGGPLRFKNSVILWLQCEANGTHLLFMKQ